jgi:hypothetical protein
MPRDFRAAPGTLTKTALNATTGYGIGAWPILSDMRIGTMPTWRNPSDEGKFPMLARVTRVLSGQSAADGPIEFEWIFPFLTHGMMAYADAYFGWSRTVPSVTGTYQTRLAEIPMHLDSAWICCNGIIHRPQPTDYTVKPNGCYGVKWLFTDGVENTS